MTPNIQTKLTLINITHQKLILNSSSILVADLKLQKTKQVINQVDSPKGTTSTKNILATTMRRIASTITPIRWVSISRLNMVVLLVLTLKINSRIITKNLNNILYLWRIIIRWWVVMGKDLKLQPSTSMPTNSHPSTIKTTCSKRVNRWCRIPKDLDLKTIKKIKWSLLVRNHFSALALNKVCKLKQSHKP